MRHDFIACFLGVFLNQNNARIGTGTKNNFLNNMARSNWENEMYDDKPAVICKKKISCPLAKLFNHPKSIFQVIYCIQQPFLSP